MILITPFLTKEELEEVCDLGTLPLLTSPPKGEESKIDFKLKIIMKIILGSDHGGFELKEILKKDLISQNYIVDDQGCYSMDPVDYPEIAKNVCKSVSDKKNNLGILICGTGIGMSMVANKIKGIRAGLCHTEIEAKLTKEHNNANILVLGGRIIGAELAKAITNIFIETPFSNEERHKRRICMLDKIRNKY